MPCFHPRKGYWARTPNPSGKRSIVFNPKEAWTDKKIDIPCGQCDGCKLERSRQWAIRCMHEAHMHEENCFITLTYNDDKIPNNGTLVKKDHQDFMKRLRERFPEKTIRYLHCGEYGDLRARPHYHTLLFGIDLRKWGRIIKNEWHLWPWKKINDVQYYRSTKLEETWPAGNSMVGALNFESAAYVARYSLKKCTSHTDKNFFYTVEDEKTGELTRITEEYITMSRHPGIAKPFYEKYKNQIFKGDFVIARGQKMKPPKFYMGQYEIDEPEKAKTVKANRQNEAIKNKKDIFEDYRHRNAEKTIQQQRTQRLKRKYESDSDH
jgi:hypothetical protein